MTEGFRILICVDNAARMRGAWLNVKTLFTFGRAFPLTAEHVCSPRRSHLRNCSRIFVIVLFYSTLSVIFFSVRVRRELIIA